MTEPYWLRIDAVMAVHRILVAEHGGVPDLRDRGLLDSALNRAVNRFAYEDGATPFVLAAVYAYGLARNHPFVDGNKRIALTSIAMFLVDNGYVFEPDRADALMTTVRLAAGDLSKEELARWIEANTRPA